MRGSVTDRSVIRNVQGDRVLVLRGDEMLLMTFVNKIGETSQLRLVNREVKAHRPDWRVTQELWEAIEPAPENKLQAKWFVEVV